MCVSTFCRAWVRGDNSVMNEIVFRHSVEEFHERFEVKEQIGVGGE